MSTQTNKMREALKLALYYLVEPTTVTLEYVPPASAMRRAADAFEKKEADIRTIQNLFAELDAHPSQTEAEAMCGDHGGIEGCSCSLCSTPLGPRELCAFCNGCGAPVKWPLADGTEYRAPAKASQTEDLEARAREWWDRNAEPVDDHNTHPSLWLAAFARSLSAPKVVDIDTVIDIRSAIVHLMGTGVTLPTNEEILTYMATTPEPDEH